VPSENLRFTSALKSRDLASKSEELTLESEALRTQLDASQRELQQRVESHQKELMMLQRDLEASEEVVQRQASEARLLRDDLTASKAQLEAAESDLAELKDRFSLLQCRSEEVADALRQIARQDKEAGEKALSELREFHASELDRFQRLLASSEAQALSSERLRGEARAEWSAESGRLRDQVSELEAGLRDAECRLAEVYMQLEAKEESLQSLKRELMEVRRVGLAP